jgi:hypothetical protein
VSASVDCADLIGRPYTYGEFDCIHLVYEVLERMQIPTPPFDLTWYEGNRVQIGRALLTWGRRIEQPTYDGDVVLLADEQLAFAVVWQAGLLYMNRQVEAVAWCPLQQVPSCVAFRCSRLSGN